MRKRSVGARRISSPVLPSLEDDAAEWLDPEVLQEIADSPAFCEIAGALACARYLDLDLDDPDVMRNVIESGVRHHGVSGAIDHVRRPRRAGLHESIVYYMALGDTIKIGTTRNIITRQVILGSPQLVAVERGDRSDEFTRHEAFAALRVRGEWFRYVDPLRSYVDAVAGSFEADFGVPLDQWIYRLQVGSPY